MFEKMEHKYGLVVWGQDPNTHVDIEVYNEPNTEEAPDYPPNGFVRLTHVWVNEDQKISKNTIKTAMIRRALDENANQYYCNQGNNEKYTDFTFQVDRFIWTEKLRSSRK